MAPTPEVWLEHPALVETLAMKPMLLMGSSARAAGSSKLPRSGRPDQGLHLPSSSCPRTLSACQQEHMLPKLLLAAPWITESLKVHLSRSRS